MNGYQKGNYDIYVVFTERGLTLLSPVGLLGFIMPHKFWQAKYGEGLRKIISQGKNLRAILDFTHNIVFHDASIYTAVHIMSSREPKRGARIEVVRLEQVDDAKSQIESIEAKGRCDGGYVFKTDHPQNASPWVILPPARSDRLARIQKSASTTLRTLAHRMAQGIRTSMNSVFVLRVSNARKGLYFSQHLQTDIQLEPDLLQPFLSAGHMRRFEILDPSEVILIPYSREGEFTGELIPSKTLKKELPQTWAYLKRCERDLRNRESGKMDLDEWYGFVYPKNIAVMKTRKILVPDIVEQPSFSFDSQGRFAFVSGYAITLKPTRALTYECLTGILNSKLIGDYLKSISTVLRGGWYRPFPQFMGQLPIKLPSDASSKTLAQKIADAVNEVTKSKTKLRDKRISDRQRTQWEREVEALEKRIDDAVFKLYGVDELPE